MKRRPISRRLWLGVMIGGIGMAADAAPARWIDSWGTAEMIPSEGDRLPPIGPAGTTLRQIARLSLGGRDVRVRFSNLFGTEPLVIRDAHVARAVAPGDPAIVPGTDRPLRFAGRSEAIIPPGAELTSDPAGLAVPAGSDLAVSLYLPSPPDRQTSHPGARATSFVVAGDHAADPALAAPARMPHWYQLADIEVASPDGTAVVAIGDSITDGHGSTTDGNDRWPDALAGRLRAAGARTGVVNMGIGGNRVLLDGLGPNLLARFDRDVIARPGVSTTILLEGINDIGTLTRDHPVDAAAHALLVARLTGAFRAMAERAHAHGIRLVGATVTPFLGSDYYHPGPASEADRQAVNRFIRTAGVFDGVVDFDAALRDPAHPGRLLAAFDSGDHLHPSPAGYAAMAAAVPLRLLDPAATAGAAADARPALALTFDDIPAHGPLPPGTSRLQVIDAIIAALKAHHAPAHGFFNAGFGVGEPLAGQVVAHWRAAGLPLGNHGYSHLDLDKVGPRPFIADVDHNEAPLARAMAGADWHWFRYPFLHEGKNAGDVAAVRRALRAGGYRIAAVTMSFGDYAWNGPYARCAASDPAAVAALEQSYLSAARMEASRARALSAALYGRDIPYVLLMHVGALDARLLDRLLDQYEAEGFRFIPLEEAERDPAYAVATDLSLTGPTPDLARQAARRGLSIPASAPLPSATLCS